MLITSIYHYILPISTTHRPTISEPVTIQIPQCTTSWTKKHSCHRTSTLPSNPGVHSYFSTLNEERERTRNEQAKLPKHISISWQNAWTEHTNINTTTDNFQDHAGIPFAQFLIFMAGCGEFSETSGLVL